MPVVDVSELLRGNVGEPTALAEQRRGRRVARRRTAVDRGRGRDGDEGVEQQDRRAVHVRVGVRDNTGRGADGQRYFEEDYGRVQQAEGSRGRGLGGAGARARNWLEFFTRETEIANVKLSDSDPSSLFFLSKEIFGWRSVHMVAINSASVRFANFILVIGSKKTFDPRPDLH